MVIFYNSNKINVWQLSASHGKNWGLIPIMNENNVSKNNQKEMDSSSSTSSLTPNRLAAFTPGRSIMSLPGPFSVSFLSKIVFIIKQRYVLHTNSFFRSCRKTYFNLHCLGTLFLKMYLLKPDQFQNLPEFLVLINIPK